MEELSPLRLLCHNQAVSSSWIWLIWLTTPYSIVSFLEEFVKTRNIFLTIGIVVGNDDGSVVSTDNTAAICKQESCFWFSSLGSVQLRDLYLVLDWRRWSWRNEDRYSRAGFRGVIKFFKRVGFTCRRFWWSLSRQECIGLGPVQNCNGKIPKGWRRPRPWRTWEPLMC
jgi:hypothetical protein